MLVMGQRGGPPLSELRTSESSTDPPDCPMLGESGGLSE